MEGSFVIVVCLGFISALCHEPVACLSMPGSKPLLAQPGDNVTMSFRLPHVLINTSLVMAFQHPDNILFMFTTFSKAPNALQTTVRYRERLQVPERLPPSRVQFTLMDVGAQDAGHYICARGLWASDVIDNCGQTLVLLDAPTNVTIASDGSPLLGTEIQLRCHASSLSLPPDHNQPMRFRWFEANTVHEGQNGASDWTEIDLSAERMSDDMTLDSASLADLNDDDGSGEIDADDLKGRNSGSLNNVLRIPFLDKKDQGRRFACGASEGLGLWSAKSSPFVLRPEWKPSSSDMTFNPPQRQVTMTMGDSKRVTCEASCQPNCTILWKKVTSGGQTVTSVKSKTLWLRRVGVYHEGNYHCVASNVHGSAILQLSVKVNEGPKPWYKDTTYIIAVVALGTLGLSLGMVGVAVIVYWCRRRRPLEFSPYKRHKNEDAIPLSASDARPSLVSYC